MKTFIFTYKFGSAYNYCNIFWTRLKSDSVCDRESMQFDRSDWAVKCLQAWKNIKYFSHRGWSKKKTTTLFDANPWVFIGQTPILHIWNGNFVSFPTVCVDFFYLKNSRSYGELKIAREFSKKQILSILKSFLFLGFHTKIWVKSLFLQKFL